MGLLDFLGSFLAKKPVQAVVVNHDPVEDEKPVIHEAIRADSSAPSGVFPARKPNALGGKAFLASLGKMGPDQRDEAIKQEILDGNVPSFMRKFVQLPIYVGKDGKDLLMIDVAPDYLCIGSDDDFVSVPMCYANLKEICDKLGCAMPTAKVVDAIWKSSMQKMDPQPLPPTSEMQSTPYMLHENELIEAMKKNRGYVNGKLIAGHKKDVVASSQYSQHPGMEAIYGWHMANGRPIQPLSFAHNTKYSDYSHGGRLIAKKAYLNGVLIDLDKTPLPE